MNLNRFVSRSSMLDGKIKEYDRPTDRLLRMSRWPGKSSELKENIEGEVGPSSSSSSSATELRLVVIFSGRCRKLRSIEKELHLTYLYFLRVKNMEKRKFHPSQPYSLFKFHSRNLLELVIFILQRSRSSVNRPT